MAKPRLPKISGMLRSIEKLLPKAAYLKAKELKTHSPIGQLDLLEDVRRKQAVLAMFNRMGNLADRIASKRNARSLGGMQWTNFNRYMGSWYSWCEVLAMMFGRDCEFDSGEWERVLKNIARFKRIDLYSHVYLRRLTAKLSKSTETVALTPDASRSLRAISRSLTKIKGAGEVRLAIRLDRIAVQGRG